MTRLPDIIGPSARAWCFKITPEERARKPHGLDSFVIHQPGVNIAWSWWVVSGCDLYEDADSGTWGKLPPKLHAPGNTHEFISFALNPKHFKGSEPPEGWDATQEEGDPPTRVWRNALAPQEFVHQEKLRDNDQANEILRLFVGAVCKGHTAVDSDFRARNIAMLAATAEHFRRGLHEVH